MTSGIIITTGNQNKPLDANTMQYLLEARVEQEMSGASRFAVRFEEDICGKFFEVGSTAALLPGNRCGIIVRENETTLKCLVIGKITKAKSSIVTGGSGSWYQIEGEDIRSELDIEEIEASWTGKASCQVKRILNDALPNPEVQETQVTYTQENSLSQSGTDLDFIEAISNENGYDLWIHYEAITLSEGVEPESIPVAMKYRFWTSPERKSNSDPEGKSNSDPSAPIFISIPILPEASGDPLTVNPTGSGGCLNTFNFSLDVDGARATSAWITALSNNGELVTEQAFVPVLVTDKDGQPAVKALNEPKPIVPQPNGTIDEQRVRAEATLAEESWFISARCSTSVHLFHKIVYPHDFLSVVGAGDVHDGSYQVSKVTHVVTTEAHMMDLDLRRNTMNASALRAKSAMLQEAARA